MNQDLRRKLQVDSDQQILMINAPEGLTSGLMDKNISFYQEDAPTFAPIHVILAFATSINELQQLLPKVLKLFKKGDSLWF